MPNPPPDQLALDLGSFTSPERLECQTRFGQHFGDLIGFVMEAVSLERRKRGEMVARKVVDPAGVQCFPDQVIQHMLWVQERRTRPDAELAEFDALSLANLNDAVVRGLLGKAPAATSSRKPRRGPASSGSSAAG